MQSLTPGNFDYFQPPSSDRESRIFGLLQRARFLESQGATEENSYEYFQLSQQLGLIQNVQPIPTPYHPPQPIIEENHVFSANQLAALRYQIMTFKLLAKNAPIPLNLQHAVLTPFHTLSSPATPTITKPFPQAKQQRKAQKYIPSPKSVTPTMVKSVANTPPVHGSYVPPFELLKKPISFHAHASKQQKTIIPSLLPTGIDPQNIISSREARILSRMRNSQTQDPRNIKQVIQRKAVQLIQKRDKIRKELVTGMSKSTVLATSVDKTSYKLKKKLSLKQVRHIESMERYQRQQRWQSMIDAEQTRLSEICEHGMTLIHNGKLKTSRSSKLGQVVLQYHQHVEKEERQKADRVAGERMQALKNDDEAAYIKLLDEAKDTRLTHLLKQTGQFLESLTLSVMEQKRESRNRGFDQELDEQVGFDYLQATHSIREAVSQPRMLVGGRLKDYQIKALQWMVSLYNNNLNGILADEMGLGKTIQTIGLIAYLIENKQQNGPFLIIAPLSTITNWTMEFDKWAPSVKKIVYKGSPQVRRDLAYMMKSGSFQVVLTTFEYIIRDRTTLCPTKWLYIIMDEGHRMKNNNSKLTVTLRQYYHTRYRLILTGTPLQNNLPELWSLLNFILPKIFKSVQTFEDWFNTPFSTQGGQDKVDLNEEEELLIIKRLHKVLRPFLLRRLKSDVESELPDKVERVLKCKFSALQLKLYQQIKKHKSIVVGQGETTPVSTKGLQNTIMHLRKVCNHPFVFEGIEAAINYSGKSNELLYRCCGKFELLDRMLPKLQATGHRVLIFFQMTSIMSIMEDYLLWRKYPYLRLDGSTKSEDRSRLLQSYNQPDSPYFIFLLSTRAGGLGLNLQTADTVIIFDSDWNPHQDLQAQDRAHRIGQTKEVRIFRLITNNSVEESILARAQYKLEIDGKVIQAGKFDHRSTEEDREKFLRTLLEDKMNEDEDDMEGEIDNEELNELLKRSDNELVVFENIDRQREKEETEMYRRRGYRKRLERLIQEDELPDMFMDDHVFDIEETPLEDLGRGRRAREDVRYDDDLSEDEWLEAIEKKKVVKSKRSKRKSYAVDDDDYEQEEHVQSHKRIASQQEDRVAPHIRQQLTKVFNACYKAVEDCIEEDEEDDSYRPRSELFMDLVDKKEYPMYYTVIKNPISMNMIKKRIQTKYYSNILEFENDFHLMFDNARLFNEEDSMVYEDANVLQEIFDNELEKQCPDGTLPVKVNHHERKRSSSRTRSSKRQ